MKEQPELNNEPLRTLLREARPAPQLPPRFQETVWRRIDKQDAVPATKPAAFGWLQCWTERLLLPRFALAGLALLLVAGGLTGFVSSADTMKQQAQERYLSAVAPNTLH